MRILISVSDRRGIVEFALRTSIQGVQEERNRNYF